MATTSITFFDIIKSKAVDYAQLLKLRLSALVVFSSLTGYVVGARDAWNVVGLLFIALSGLVITGAANTINQIIERNSDKLMERTANRPLPAGRMTVSEATIIAGVLGVVGICLISFYFNPLAGVISAVSLFLYGFLYTPLKKTHPIAVFVGAIPGALPPLIGVIAATGEFTMAAYVLFSLQFLWQFPHFWAINWIKYEDYLKADIMLLPASGKNQKTAFHSIAYTLALVAISFFAYYLNELSFLPCLLVFAAGICYLYTAIQLFVKPTDKSARTMMFASFFYLPIILIAFLINLI